MRYQSLPAGVALYSSEQVRAIELAYAELDPQGTFPLMLQAGQSAFDELCQQWPNVKRVLVVTGKGNNGGDGYVVARLAQQAGIATTLCNLCPEADIKGDALLAYQMLPDSGLDRSSWEALDLNRFDLVVDAMLGTGIRGAVREPFASIIEQINQLNLPVLSIDIPSGLQADTGHITNVAIKADLTVTYIGYKPGLFTGRAADCRGRLVLYKLGVADNFYAQQVSQVFSDNWQSINYLLLPRQATAHKGDHGHCCIIGGSHGMSGAAQMAATAAARSGSGLTSARVESDASQMAAARPEIMFAQVDKDSIDTQNYLPATATTLVVGPGLGQGDWGQRWMRELLADKTTRTLGWVVDADGLNWLADNPQSSDNWVLTPHPGEAARLLGVTTAEVNSDRYQASRKIAERFGGICVLKGAGTVISDGAGKQMVCAVANPGMASGGMGDVLSGIIGGLLAQGFGLFEAACLGVCIHAEAAERCAGDRGLYRGMLATDLLAQLPPLLNPD